MIILKESIDFDIDFTAPSKEVLEEFMVDHEVEFDEWYTVMVGEKIYRIITEGWFPDCLESRNMGETNEKNISELYVSIMENENQFGADIWGYMPEYPGTEYGVTYIGEEIPI